MKKKFDRVNGETRICKECDNEFYTMTPKYRCNICQYKKQKPMIDEKFEKKDKYPFDVKKGEAKKRFNRIRRELNNCWDSEERRAHYDKQLKEIETNGVLKWILDRRDRDSLDEGRTKRQSQIRKDYPDTRSMQE